MNRRIIYAIIGIIIVSCKEKNDESKNSFSSEDGYELVWQDEFEYSGELDPAKWNFETGLSETGKNNFI